MQNFSEDFWLDDVLEGQSACPGGDVPTPFLDAEDIADVAVAALTETATRRALRADRAAVADLRRGRGGDLGRHRPRGGVRPGQLEQLAAEAAEQGLPAEVIELLAYLFTEVIDGRNAETTDGVRRALGASSRLRRLRAGGGGERGLGSRAGEGVIDLPIAPASTSVEPSAAAGSEWGEGEGVGAKS